MINHVTTTIIKTITTYIPYSSAIATQGSSTIYSSSLTESHVTRTITSVYAETTVICPVTKGGPAPSGHNGQNGQKGRKGQDGRDGQNDKDDQDDNTGSSQSPKVTQLVTTTRYICPTAQPACPTGGSLHKRAAGFDGPAFTLSNGQTGSGSGGGTNTVTVTEPSTVSTTTSTSTVYESTITETGACSGTAPAR